MTPSTLRHASDVRVPAGAPGPITAGTTAASSALALAAWVLLCAGGGALIGVWSNGGDDPWYQALQKPAWNPPAWVFAPVWTTLYLLMGSAAWRVWRHGGWARQGRALGLFVGQLAVNFAWSPLFFNARQPALAMADLAVLWVLVAMAIWTFSRIDSVAAWLLAPYLAWVSYAATLNGAIVVLN